MVNPSNFHDLGRAPLFMTFVAKPSFLQILGSSEHTSSQIFDVLHRTQVQHEWKRNGRQEQCTQIEFAKEEVNRKYESIECGCHPLGKRQRTEATPAGSSAAPPSPSKELRASVLDLLTSSWLSALPPVNYSWAV